MEQHAKAARFVSVAVQPSLPLAARIDLALALGVRIVRSMTVAVLTVRFLIRLRRTALKGPFSNTLSVKVVIGSSEG